MNTIARLEGRTSFLSNELFQIASMDHKKISKQEVEQMKLSFNSKYAELKPAKITGVAFGLLILVAFLGFAVCGYLVGSAPKTFNDTTQSWDSSGPPFWILVVPLIVFIATPISARFYYAKKLEELLKGLNNHANQLSEKYQAHGLELLFTRETESYSLRTTHHGGHGGHSSTRITPNYVYVVTLKSQTEPEQRQQFITFVQMPATVVTPPKPAGPELPMYSR